MDGNACCILVDCYSKTYFTTQPWFKLHLCSIIVNYASQFNYNNFLITLWLFLQSLRKYKIYKTAQFRIIYKCLSNYCSNPIFGAAAMFFFLTPQAWIYSKALWQNPLAFTRLDPITHQTYCHCSIVLSKEACSCGIIPRETRFPACTKNQQLTQT